MSTTKWITDPAHSDLNFRVKHLMISNVKGSFNSFQAFIEGDDFTTAPVRVEIDATSVTTNNTDRDAHLNSADFFDTAQFPKLIFEGKSVQKIDEENYKLTGLLTIKNISKEVVLNVEYGGLNKDPWGVEKMAFTVEGRINRKDWELNWNAALETGGVLVSDEVRISADVQFVKQNAS
ncbi:MAG: YceI family protein [Bacteroidales bacterium]|jgi:polyisoprenoid-binding protein YceI|nr:YceI family protein [Bacteroidales bacterium]MCK9449225.1 YceI family protein [Bacteroidales bacterium]MDD3700446.1 YceI family protein [Bacteroidales bacterium]MDY0368668.1 YceI family protein [Bacteroidales bacterium]